MKIADSHITRLRSEGLFVAPSMPPDHAFPGGVLVGKPKTVSGNCIQNYSIKFMLDVEKDEHIEFDSPPVWLFGHCGIWVVQGQECSPVPGPADFLNEWSSVEAAVQDILDFYFGDPKRMLAKAAAWNK